MFVKENVIKAANKINTFVFWYESTKSGGSNTVHNTYIIVKIIVSVF